MTLLEATHATFRRLHYSPRTEEAYLHWIRAFVRFHQRRHPRDMGAPEIVAFLDDLATERRVSASTLNQALCAIVFLYRRVLDLPAPNLDGLEHARRPVHLPGAQLDRIAALHRAELDAGRGEVELPHALREKLPNAARSLRVATTHRVTPLPRIPQPLRVFP